MLFIHQKKVKQRLKRFITFILLFYIMISASLYLLQDKILFRPTVLAQDYQYEFKHKFEEVFINTDEEAVINAIHFKVENPKLWWTHNLGEPYLYNLKFEDITTKSNVSGNSSWNTGAVMGDINGDGLLDVGSAPNAGQNTLKIYTQELDGTFTNNDDLLQLVDNRQPFTLDFSDLDNDGIDEIITANYGGGDPSQDPLLNNIRVYKYSSSSEQFEINFMSNNSTAFYDIGLGATSILTEDFDGDGIKDIVVAREDIDGNSFEIWKGISDGSYVPHFSSPVWTENELQFREFRIFDVNNDGFLDIILRPFHYGNLYRNNSDCWWNVKQCNGIKLNTIIQINNGDGTFSSYDREELIIDSIDVDNVHPYMENGILHFIGTHPYNVDNQYFDYQLSTYDIKVRILN